MSPRAVERIQFGIACSVSGWISRLSVMAQVSWMALAEKPEALEDHVEFQPLPELEADVNGTG